MKLFMVLPLMHDETLESQKECIEYLKTFAAELPESEQEAAQNTVKFGVWHEEIIKQFGRFPHRNAILGRTSTREETEYLEKGGRTF